MEEISWGQRWAGVSAPAFFEGRNIQGEINIHNLFESWAYIGAAVRVPFVYAVVGWLAATLSPSIAHVLSKLGLPVVAPRLWPFFALPMYVIDYHGWLAPLVRRDELAEFFGALALAALSLEVAFRRGSAGRWQSPRANAILVGAIALLAGVLAGGRSDADAMRYQFHRLSQRGYPELRMYRQALAITEHVDDRPDLEIEENRLQRGLLLLPVGEDAAAASILSEELSKAETALAGADDAETRLQAAIMALGLCRLPSARAHAAAARERARALVGPWGEAYRALAAHIIEASADEPGDTEASPRRFREWQVKTWMRSQKTRLEMIRRGSRCAPTVSSRRPREVSMVVVQRPLVDAEHDVFEQTRASPHRTSTVPAVHGVKASPPARSLDSRTPTEGLSWGGKHSTPPTGTGRVSL